VFCAALLLCAGPALAFAQPGELPPELLPQQILVLPRPDGAPGKAASVVLELDVDAEGAVSSAEVVDAAVPAGSEPVFVSAALVHALSLRFAPARRDGTAVSARVRVELRFESTATAPPLTASSENAGESVEASSSGSSLHPAAAVPAASEPPSEEFGARALLVAGAGPSRTSAASDFDIELGALRSVPRRRAEQYLTLAPGVLLQNHSGTGHASSVLLRGFDAGEGEDLEVTVDGVPINEPSNAHAHGYADTGFVIPEVVDRLRVIEGPFDPT
jgi:iron complex outermembrane recepter protein